MTALHQKVLVYHLVLPIHGQLILKDDSVLTWYELIICLLCFALVAITHTKVSVCPFLNFCPWRRLFSLQSFTF